MPRDQESLWGSFWDALLAHRRPPAARTVARLWPSLPRLNFITIHYVYFLGSLLVSSLIFWGSSKPSKNISYVDSLFMVVSGMTETGLNTVALSAMTTWQQVILYLTILFGGSVWVSIWIVAYRKYVVEQRLDAVARARCLDVEIGSRSLSLESSSPRHVSAKERDQIGGNEYRALRVLSVVIPLYYFLWQLLGSMAIASWVAHHMPEVARANAVDPWWVGIFVAASAFNNSGLSLLDDNMIPFQSAYLVLTIMCLLILAGNTAYPIFLRFIFWAASELLRLFTRHDQFANLKATITYILRYPRRLHTTFFPSRSTWWLFFMVMLINCVEWVGFELLNIHNPVVKAIPIGPRIMDGLFQAIAVRSGGFSVVAMSDLRIGILVLYVITMYIPVFPMTTHTSTSDIYDECSLGIYTRHHVRSPVGVELEDTTPAEDVTISPSQSYNRNPSHGNYESLVHFVWQQIQNMLSNDIWMLALAVFLISAIETSSFLRDPVDYSVFNAVFEVISSYGCVGVSLGTPNESYSLSGSYHAASKVVLCVVMVKGRHRGLPVSLDRSVQLAEAQIYRDEEEEGYHI